MADLTFKPVGDDLIAVGSSGIIYKIIHPDAKRGICECEYKGPDPKMEVIGKNGKSITITMKMCWFKCKVLVSSENWYIYQTVSARMLLLSAWAQRREDDVVLG